MARPIPPSPAQRLEAALREAGSRQASDLALDPDDDGSLRILARIDGVRQVLGRIERDQVAGAIARCKALASLPAYIVDEAQDGRIDGRPFGIPGDLRLAVLPTARGQRLALRLPALGELPPPEGLGLVEDLLTEVRRWFARPEGLILVCGPTGSGKSTTIHSLLAEVAATRPDRQVVSIEDPVERRIPGLAQVQVRPKQGFGFGEALAAALRQDADILVVGEIRDPATATACVRAALTGHLVVSTLHCARAAEAVPRLLEVGVDADLLLPVLHGVLAQRLLRLRHAPCAGAGCADCSAGYRGRRAIADALRVDAPARAAWRSNRLPPPTWDMEAQAAALVSQDLSDLSEVRRVLAC